MDALQPVNPDELTRLSNCWSHDLRGEHANPVDLIDLDRALNELALLNERDARVENAGVAPVPGISTGNRCNRDETA